MKNFIITLLAIFTIAISATAQDTTSVIIPNRWLVFDNPSWEGKNIYDFISETGDTFRVYENGFCIISSADEFIFNHGIAKVRLNISGKHTEMQPRPFAENYFKGYFQLSPEILSFLNTEKGEMEISTTQQHNENYTMRIPTLASSEPYRMNRPPYIYRK